MLDLMIDLETMGTTPQAPIIAIGAVFFNPKTGEQGDSFYVAIDFESACKLRSPDANTIKWWMKQGDAARNAAIKGTADMKEALIDFIAFIKTRDHTKVKVWGNGATFDISMLEDCIRQYRGRVPWSFWNIRDVRTIVDIAADIGVRRDDVPFEGVAHHALHDAKHQAKYVSRMYKALTKVKEV